MDGTGAVPAGFSVSMTTETLAVPRVGGSDGDPQKRLDGPEIGDDEVHPEDLGRVGRVQFRPPWRETATISL